MWSHQHILESLRRKEAHTLLKEKKLSKIEGDLFFVNGYEFGLFCPAATCVLLAQTMQVNGTVYEEMIAPLIQQLACKREAQRRVMRVIYWDLDIVRAFARRQDGHFFLRQGDFNGYEMGLLEDKGICNRLGFLAKHFTHSISEVVHYKYFVQAPRSHIKEFYNS
jgi:hypothetical protein